MRFQVLLRGGGKFTSLMFTLKKFVTEVSVHVGLEADSVGCGVIATIALKLLHFCVTAHVCSQILLPCRAIVTLVTLKRS